MNLPTELRQRNSIDPKLAVGSSLPKPKELLSWVITLFLVNNGEYKLEYAESADDNKIKIKQNVFEGVKTFFSSVGNYDGIYFDDYQSGKENPLCDMQLEPLQVSLQLVWKLAKINATSSSSSSLERTGGVRVLKKLEYTTNVILIKNLLENNNGEVDPYAKQVLYNWIIGTEVETEYESVEAKLISTLSVFTEDTLFKVWSDESTEVIFQQESIYNKISGIDDDINLKGTKEPKGTLRNLKSILANDLHPFLKIQLNQVSLKSDSLLDTYLNYISLVSNFLDLVPRTLLQGVEIVNQTSITDHTDSEPRSVCQIIFYGSPGTGKSRKTKQLTNDQNFIRTTFHPETDYQSFVGSYRPVMNGEDIRYEFVPQAFSKAYCNAWLDQSKQYFLIIEEINRGNCAQIFGDIFQCLDRDDNGYSEYSIEVSTELSDYIQTQLKDMVNIDEYEYITNSSKGKFNSIKLPSNLSILATMNTSDQSLFPMDSAFKRRWDWEFIPIDYTDAECFNIEVGDSIYSWSQFIKVINKRIMEATGSEDKQLGNRFVNPTNKIITLKQFKSKVLFYLWDEIYKDEYQTNDSIFKHKLEDKSEGTDFTFNELFEDQSNQIIKSFLDFHEINPIEIEIENDSLI